MRRLVRIALPLVGAALGLFAPAASAAPTRIAPADLDGIEAKRRVIDTILPASSSASARAAVAARTERWLDDQGRPITISTDLPTVDLSPFAAILAGTRHGDEIMDLRVTAVALAQVAGICGSPDAVACYAPDDPDSSYAGEMWFAVDDPDVVHTIVHEYGHHVDNQLVNFGHLDVGCGWHNDGSRNWFFARDLEDDILGAGATCDPGADWAHLLAELYAEDFVALNGIIAWELPTFRSPSRSQLAALAYDMRVPFEPGSRVWRPRVRFDRDRYRSIALKHWTFATIRLRSPRRRDFDLYLYRAGRRRWLDRSIRPGRFDRIEQLLAPGRYFIDVYGFRGRGRAQVRIDLE